MKIFKPRAGVAMRSKSSPSLSYVFVDLLENSIIPKFIKSKKILHWSRFADDIICICEKSSKTEILNKLNSYDHRLNFTTTKMINKEILFLDCQIFI